MALGETLVSKSLISTDQLNKALEEQKKNPAERLGSVIVRMGFASQADIDKALS